MAKYIVFEEIDRRRGKAEELYLFEGQVHTVFVTTAGDVPILRRLTDEEVEGLLISQEILKTHSRTVGAIWWDDIAMKWQSAPKPADDERGRFVRETARMFYAAQLIDRAGPWCPFAEAKAFTEKIW